MVVVDSTTEGVGDGGAPSAASIEAIAGAEIYLGYGFPRALFEAAIASGPTLRWVHSGSAGIGGALHPAMVESDILLTNSAGIHAEPMADTVIAMIHYFARGLDFAVQAQQQRRWMREPFDRADTVIHEIAGSTLGIIGYGGIGRAVARRATGLGMNVLAFRRRPIATADDGVRLVRGDEGLRTLLTTSDYILLALPRTPETERFLDRERLALLHPRAVIINMGRGELIDEDALVEALENRRVRGAGLDVFVREPLPSNSLFWTFPNVLITPHVSAITDRFWRREIDLVIENLNRYAKGERLLNLVDKRAGY